MLCIFFLFRSFSSHPFLTPLFFPFLPFSFPFYTFILLLFYFIFLGYERDLKLVALSELERSKARGDHLYRELESLKADPNALLHQSEV